MSRSWLVGVFSFRRWRSNNSAPVLYFRRHPPRLSFLSLSRSCPRGAFCSWWVFSRAVSVGCWVSCLGFVKLFSYGFFAGFAFWYCFLLFIARLGGISFSPLFLGCDVYLFLSAFLLFPKYFISFLFLFLRRLLYRQMSLASLLFLWCR